MPRTRYARRVRATFNSESWQVSVVRAAEPAPRRHRAPVAQSRGTGHRCDQRLREARSPFPCQMGCNPSGFAHLAPAQRVIGMGVGPAGPAVADRASRSAQRAEDRHLDGVSAWTI
jgi:hypothetical protein